MLASTLVIMMLLGGKAFAGKLEVKPTKEEIQIILREEN